MDAKDYFSLFCKRKKHELYLKEIERGYIQITKSKIPLNCNEFDNQITRCINRMGYCNENLTIDFSKVRETESSCLAVLIKAFAKARKQGITLKVNGINKKLTEQIRIAKLESIINSQQQS
jgi:anti-anti-sigma regulatory factor